MSFVPHIGLWDIWSDAARNLEALKDPLLLECLEAADDHRVFDDVVSAFRQYFYKNHLIIH